MSPLAVPKAESAPYSWEKYEILGMTTVDTKGENTLHYYVSPSNHELTLHTISQLIDLALAGGWDSTTVMLYLTRKQPSNSLEP
jgi:hypothetical protein